MSRVVFFYFHGTDPLIGQWLAAIGQAQGQQSLGTLTVPGISRTTTWLDGSPRNDPFCSLLDPNIFEAYSVAYPALFIPFAPSVNTGITKLIALINALPDGQKYMIGGYSQGAVIAGTVYSRIKSGQLGTKAANNFLGGLCFGSPIRQQDYRGEVGGNWSGCWDIPNSGTGGHGQFATNGTFPRLTNCDPTRWIEFADYGDIFACTSDTQRGRNWTAASNVLNDITNLLTLPASLASVLADVGAAMGPEYGQKVNTYTDATGRVFDFPGNGHTAYPWRPPPGDPDNGLTSYQIAVKWLTGKALQYATAPIVMPTSPTGDSSTTAGWTTQLTA
jgi:hypothetical protein